MRLLAQLITLTLALLASSALAVPLRFDFMSACAIDCSNIGLANGASVGGFIVLDGDTFDTTTGTYSSTANPNTVIDFGLSFGDISLTPADTFALFFFGASTDFDRGALDFWQLRTSTSNNFLSTGDGVVLQGFAGSPPTSILGSAGKSTFCPDPNCESITTDVISVNSARLIAFDPITAVPLPASGLLVLCGLGVLTGYRARHE